MADIKWLEGNRIQITPPKKTKKITGTRFATILGLNPWSTAFEMWCAITKTYVENSIYPTYREELIERRVHQDRAVGQCYGLTQELQYAIETLPVDVNKYLRFAEMIQTEINLLKGWRKSDNKFKSALQEGNL